MALVAEELGIEVIGYQTVLYGASHVKGIDEAVALLRTIGPDDAVLVKGSRVARLEDVVALTVGTAFSPGRAAGATAGAGSQLTEQRFPRHVGGNGAMARPDSIGHAR